MYCVKFKGNLCSVGYIRPWNSVRDEETYSLTYIPTSFINGIEYENHLSGKILRHKLRFKGQVKETFVSEERYGLVEHGTGKNKVLKYQRTRSHFKSTIHLLSAPEIILGFENYQDAEEMSRSHIYVGQTQYMIFPVNFNGDSPIIVELSDDEFSKLPGTETFESTDSDECAVYCGNNRYKNNERMYIRIIRTK